MENKPMITVNQSILPGISQYDGNEFIIKESLVMREKTPIND